MGFEASSKIDKRTASSRRPDATGSPFRQQTLKSAQSKRKQKRNRETARTESDLRNGNVLPRETGDTCTHTQTNENVRKNEHKDVHKYTHACTFMYKHITRHGDAHLYMNKGTRNVASRAACRSAPVFRRRGILSRRNMCVDSGARYPAYPFLSSSSCASPLILLLLLPFRRLRFPVSPLFYLLSSFLSPLSSFFSLRSRFLFRLSAFFFSDFFFLLSSFSFFPLPSSSSEITPRDCRLRCTGQTAQPHALVEEQRPNCLARLFGRLIDFGSARGRSAYTGGPMWRLPKAPVAATVSPGDWPPSIHTQAGQHFKLYKLIA